jgi:hypothetical protein
MDNPGNEISISIEGLQDSVESCKGGKEERGNMARKGRAYIRVVAFCEANIAYLSLTPRPDSSSPIRRRLASFRTQMDPETGAANPLPIWKSILRLVKGIELGNECGIVSLLEDDIHALYCIYIPEPTSLDDYQSDVLGDRLSRKLTPEQREKLGATGSDSWSFDRLTDTVLLKKLWHAFYREFPWKIARIHEIVMSNADVKATEEEEATVRISQEPAKESSVKSIGESEMNIVVASSDEEVSKALRDVFPFSRVAFVSRLSCYEHLIPEVSKHKNERATYQSAEKQLRHALDKADPFKDVKVKANVFFAVEHGMFKEKLPTGYKLFGNSCILGQVLLKPGVWLVLDHCWTSPILLAECNDRKSEEDDEAKVLDNGQRIKDSVIAELIRSFMLPQIKKCY